MSAVPDSRVAARREALPFPGERYLDRDGRTITVVIVTGGLHREERVIGHFQRPGELGRESGVWPLSEWEQLIAVGPLVDAEAVPA